ncbi:MAG: carboxypeptidase-like regulatory domain-containing protein [Gemmatimonadales bacterium]
MRVPCAQWRIGVLLLAGACAVAGEDSVLGIEATGEVHGIAYFDRNGNRRVDSGDTALAGLPVRLIAWGTRDTTARASSATSGAFLFASVPVGRYVVAIGASGYAESLDVVRVIPETVLVRPDSADTVLVALSFPIVTISQARGLVFGDKVFVEGAVLNVRAAFGDSTVHLGDAAAAIRSTRVRVTPLVLPGDSARFLGVRSERDGQPVLDEVVPFPLAPGPAPAPRTVSAPTAATADAGALDAALVLVSNVTVVDTATIAGTGSPPNTDLRVLVDETPTDTLGRLEVLLDGHAGFSGGALAPFVPDAVLDVTGLLVPTAPGRWRLKPRSPADVVVK